VQLGEMERLANLLKDIAFGNAARVTLVDGRAQGLQFGLVKPLVALL
jgi:hypothetical protein